MSKYVSFNAPELQVVLDWAEAQGNHKLIGLYQVGDWLIVIEPIKMGRPKKEETDETNND